MRAVTPEEIEKIAGGLTKKAPPKMRAMLVKPPKTLSTINVSPPPSSSVPPFSNPPGTSALPPTSGGGGGGSEVGPVAASASASYSFIMYGMNVYLPFIYAHENTSATIVNVPSGSSGVTVGYGVDLNSQDTTHLQAYVTDGYISQSLESTLASMDGKVGAAASAALASAGLQSLGNGQYEFAASDASMLTQLSNVVYGEIMAPVNTAYQSATSSVMQGDGIQTQESLVYLPLEAQTAVTDVSIWYGPDHVKTELDAGNFWKDFTNFKWTDAVSEMHKVANEYMDSYNNGTDPNGKGAANRLNSDASLLQWDIDHGTLVNGIGTQQYNDQSGGNDPVLT